jgi:hypothetical protein
MKRFLTLLALSSSPGLLYSQATDELRPEPRCNHGARTGLLPLAVLVAMPCLATAQALNIPWSGYGHDAQHTAVSATAAQTLSKIHWQTPVDLNPPGGGSGDLYVHYGSPVVTAGNTVIVPVGNNGAGFQLNAFNGATGAAIYTLTSDYSLPSHGWTPPYGPALSLGTRLYYPGAGGTLYYRDLPNAAAGPNGLAGASGQVAFYGMTGTNGYKTGSNAAVYNSTVRISTPLTIDHSGNIFFGFIVTGSNPAHLVSGIARVTITGTGSWVSATSLTGDGSAGQVALNCAPAISNDQHTVYVVTSNGNEFGTGYLVSANAANLAPLAHVALYDPRNPTTVLATVSSDSSASPLVGPDGDVYYGVLETPCCASHRDRGWLLHFNSTLTTAKTPGSFGWDDTASVVPSSAVPSYSGSSPYLLLTKYNNYADPGIGGDGVNKVAILDPSATMQDEYSPSTPVTVMQEVISVAGVTADASNGGLPAVREWCINTAAIDPYTKSAIINSEDGTVYRWDFTTNTLLQSLSLTSGRGEAYTPTVIGPDGTVYAINDAILFAVGS